jgi:hypothetical protein
MLAFEAQLAIRIILNDWDAIPVSQFNQAYPAFNEVVTPVGFWKFGST